MEWSKVMLTFLWSMSTWAWATSQGTASKADDFEFVKPNKMAAPVVVRAKEERPMHKVPRLLHHRHQGQLIKVAL